MCSSYTSGLCGAPEPQRDMGEMPSARQTLPDVLEVLSLSINKEHLVENTLHYGTPPKPDSAFLIAYCGTYPAFCTDKIGKATCAECLGKIRAFTAERASQQSHDHAAPEHAPGPS